MKRRIRDITLNLVLLNTKQLRFGEIWCKGFLKQCSPLTQNKLAPLGIGEH